VARKRACFSIVIFNAARAEEKVQVLDHHASVVAMPENQYSSAGEKIPKTYA